MANSVHDAASERQGYIPRWLRGRLASHPGEQTGVQAAPLQVVAAFFDISGFSAISRKFRDKGDVGVEELARIVDDYLGKLIDVVTRWGGDVESLYGDALLAFWREDANGCERAVSSARRCADEIIRRYDRARVGTNVEFRIRGAIVHT